MQDRYQIKALRDCHIRATWTDANNVEIGEQWIDMKKGESRGDIQFVTGLDPDLSDLPDDYQYLDGSGIQTVAHPSVAQGTIEVFGLLQLSRIR